MQMYTLIRVLYTIAGSVYLSRKIFFTQERRCKSEVFHSYIHVCNIYMYIGDGTRQLFSSCKIKV